MKIAVFCSSSTDVSPMLLSEIERLGEGLADDGHEIVYGGANEGCMGALARGVLRKSGRLIGVVPQMDFMLGVVQENLTEQKVVPTLSARKTVMIDLSDAFLVYPGGLGTLDEALEVLALKTAGIVTKPVFFYNFLDIWTPLLEALDLLREQRLVRQRLNELFHVLDNVTDLRENLLNGLGTAK